MLTCLLFYAIFLYIDLMDWDSGRNILIEDNITILYQFIYASVFVAYIPLVFTLLHINDIDYIVYILPMILLSTQLLVYHNTPYNLPKFKSTNIYKCVNELGPSYLHIWLKRTTVYDKEFENIRNA